MLPRGPSTSLELEDGSGAPTILTIGHSTLAIEMFLKILLDNECRMLVDIRTVPRSRYNPQFEQETLQASMESAGIEYRWKQDLGGLRHPRKNSINFGWRNSSFRGYADYMQTAQFFATIEELLALPSPGIVLMCAEAVPWRCHRSLVGDALLAREVPVEDIFYDVRGQSHRKPHILTSFARVEGERVWYPPEDDLFADVAAEGA